jgi:putative protease
MIEDGIDSFKIEGRMRSIYYIATILNVYRRAIDSYFLDKENYKYNQEDEIILRNCANRDSVAQFYNNINDESIGYYNGRQEVSNQEFLGVVLEYNKSTKMAKVEERNFFKKGDYAIAFGPSHEPFSFKINKILDNGEEIDVVRHPMQIVEIEVDSPLEKWDLIRLKH